MDDLAYLEGLAGQALRLVDDDSKRVSMATIGRLLGLRIVRVAIGELPRGVLGSIYGGVVCVRTGLTPITERFVLGHEFGHLGAVSELDADYVAAALVVPRRALFQPSSADFSGIFNSHTSMEDDCTETFASKVESKNAFGATISHNFSCSINDKKKKPLTLDSLTMS